MTTLELDHTRIDLDKIVLHRGPHKNPQEGHCLLEVTAMFSGEAFSDNPDCVDPALRMFGMCWNDGMRTDEERAQLKQYITRLGGTNKRPALAKRRGWMALDWLIRVHTPTWLALTPSLAHHATRLRAVDPITNIALLFAVQAHVRAAQAAVVEADLDASFPATYPGQAAIGAAAGRAAKDAASVAFEVDDWVAAGAAFINVVGGAVNVAINAASCAHTRISLEPAVLELQASAHGLFSRMIDARI